MASRGLDYAAYLLQKVAGGKVAEGCHRSKSTRIRRKENHLAALERVNRSIGTQLSADEIAALAGQAGDDHPRREQASSCSSLSPPTAMTFRLKSI